MSNSTLQTPTEDIPPALYGRLLPHPGISVSSLLSFSLPVQLSGIFGTNHLKASDFWSIQESVPMSDENLERLCRLAVPSSSVLDLFLRDFPLALEANQIKSIIYAHLPTSNPASTTPFPLWVFSYWLRVSQIRQYARTPWTQAENWASSQHLMRFSERKQLASDVIDALGQIPWTGNISGFAESEPLIKIAGYLSSKWLATTHIEQQLDLLRLRISRHHASPTKYEIVGTHFFTKIIQLFRQRETSTYNGEIPSKGAHSIWTVGRELADQSSRKTVVCGVLNVSNTHWVSVAVDVEMREVLFGDSLESNAKVREEVDGAVSWWLGFHFQSPHHFAFVDLKTSRQSDSFSCGVFAVNSIKHLVFPQDSLLQTHEALTERYRWFLATVERHNDVCPDIASGYLDASLPSGIPTFKATSLDGNIVLEKAFIPLPDHYESEFLAVIRSSPAPVQTQHDKSPGTSHEPPSSIPVLQKRPCNSSDPSINKRQKKLGTWFKQGTRDDLVAYHQRTDLEWSENLDEIRLQDVKKRTRQKELATDRKRRQRGRQTADEIESGKRDSDGKIITRKPSQSLFLISEPQASGISVPEASRPNRVFKEELRQARGPAGRPREVAYRPSVLTNWMTPLLWSMISRAATVVGPKMSSSDICKELKKKDPILFAKLAPQTIGAWIDRSGGIATWSDRTLERVNRGNHPGGLKTRVGILVAYPKVTEDFLTYLQGLRQSSVALTLVTIRGLLVGHLEYFSPDIFTLPSRDGSVFRCSDIFVRKFIKRSLGWTIRRSTRAGQKTPSNADAICTNAFLRAAYIVKHEDIPSELMANSDQTQVLLQQGCNMTYAPIGAKQVMTVGSEEKRAITVFVTLTNDGVVLPFQTIYKGSTAGSRPSQHCRSMTETLEAGFLFESSKTSTYWSTQATMRNFVDTILAPHFESVKVKLGLPHEQCSLWMIDCWSVHRSDEFLSWMIVTHITIIVLFVPAGCTGLFQACDVGFQRIFKHSLKLSAHSDVVQEVLAQLKAGVAVSDIKIDTTLGVLRDRTVHWLWTAFQTLNKPEIVKKAWKMCKAGGFDLSYESLTSHEARQTLRNLPQTDPVFFAEISQPRSRPILTEIEALQEDSDEQYGGSAPTDDSDVPLGEVAAHSDEVVAGPLVPEGGDVDHIYVLGEEGGLSSAAEAEDTLLEAIGDVTVDVTTAYSGRPRRTRRANVLYSDALFTDADQLDLD